MDKFLKSERTAAAKTKIRKQGTMFAAHCDPQFVGSRGLRNTTYIYSFGKKSRATTKPE